MKVDRLLTDRLTALRNLASSHSGDPAAALLAVAAMDPPDDAIYVVNGQPVIVGWGRRGHRAPAPRLIPTPPVPGPAAAAAVAVATAGRSAFPWWLVGGLAALLLCAALLWWLWPLVGLGSSGDRMAALQAEEAALTADIAAAEAELRKRLSACTIGQIPTGQIPTGQIPAPAKEVAAAPPPAEVAAKPEAVTPPPEIKPVPQQAPAKKPAPPQEPALQKPPPQEPPKQHAKEEQTPPTPPAACPPPRKKWEAPELVLLLDASGSMRLKAGVSQEEVTALLRRARAGDRAAAAQLAALNGGGGNDRLTAAKAAVKRLLATLPTDMDVGLVVFGDCQGADSHKFFSPAERPRLNSLLESIRPMNGTPLARGIERAGNTVDGRTVPATLVVVTDGEDSCGGDPCAAARALKASKPKVTINVVDVNGLGEGRCIAEATGGRVLPMKSATELPELIRKASGEAPVPPGCD